MREAVDSPLDLKDVEDGKNILKSAMITTCVYLGLIVAPTVIICCIVVKCRNHCCLKALTISTLAVEFSICIPVIIWANEAKNSYADKSEKLTELDASV